MKPNSTDPEARGKGSLFWLPTKRDLVVAVLAVVVYNGGWVLISRMNEGIRENDLVAVSAQLRARNPGFNGEITNIKKDGFKVLRVGICTDAVANLSPLKALPGLEELMCTGSGHGTARLADLRPLTGLKLHLLHLNNNSQITDLSPLKTMPLHHLNLWGWGGSDLSPLRGMPLVTLNCGSSPVSDLKPLADLPLENLVLNYTKVTDLSPLKGTWLKTLSLRSTAVTDLSPLIGLQLTELNIVDTEVTDLSPLSQLPLVRLWCDYKPERDAAILRSIKTLKVLNDRPALQF